MIKNDTNSHKSKKEKEILEIKKSMIKYLIISFIFLILWVTFFVVIIWISGSDFLGVILITFSSLLLPLLLICMIIVAHKNDLKKLQNSYTANEKKNSYQN